jgi:DNA mismatch repair protein MutS2
MEDRVIVVEIEGKRIRSEAKALSKVAGKEVTLRPANHVQVRVVEDTNPELNLIGKTVEEALASADKFLDRAFVSQLREVRIVHGFGTGRLKRSLSDFLGSHPHVAQHQVEGGATRVFLKQ